MARFGTRFGASVGKQRGDESKRIDFGAHAQQGSFFFTQHFIYVFHGRQAGPAQAPKQLSCRNEPRVTFRLNEAIIIPICPDRHLQKKCVCRFTLRVVSKPVRQVCGGALGETYKWW